jgi:hypothetical protein
VEAENKVNIHDDPDGIEPCLAKSMRFTPKIRVDEQVASAGKLYGNPYTVLDILI